MSAARAKQKEASSAPRTSPEQEARAFAVAAARIADENKAAAVRVLDLRGLSNLADFFLIGTGTSQRQMRAVLDAIERHARSVGRRAFAVDDEASATWVLADYVDVVVHIFGQEHREYYDLDGLWGDAPEVDWKSEAAAERAGGSPTGSCGFRVPRTGRREPRTES